MEIIEILYFGYFSERIHLHLQIIFLEYLVIANLVVISSNYKKYYQKLNTY